MFKLQAYKTCIMIKLKRRNSLFNPTFEMLKKSQGKGLIPNLFCPENIYIYILTCMSVV